jgi:hypothetical protein
MRTSESRRTMTATTFDSWKVSVRHLQQGRNDESNQLNIVCFFGGTPAGKQQVLSSKIADHEI